jgi:hypothetical protein
MLMAGMAHLLRQTVLLAVGPTSVLIRTLWVPALIMLALLIPVLAALLLLIPRLILLLLIRTLRISALIVLALLVPVLSWIALVLIPIGHGVSPKGGCLNLVEASPAEDHSEAK